MPETVDKHRRPAGPHSRRTLADQGDHAREDAIFGGEHSGHFYFRDNWYADCGLLAMLTMLELVSEAGRPVSEVLEPLDTRFRSGEINSEVADPNGVLANIESLCAPRAQRSIIFDGITVAFHDWWFNVRSSNTQPLLRLNLEADDRSGRWNCETRNFFRH